MLKYTLLAASLGCAALAIGCQNSGHATAEADEHPEMTTTAAPASYSASTDLTAYNTPYTLKHDSSYMMSPSSTVSAGTLRSGDTVYLRSGTMLDTNANGWVAAKTADGRLVYVRSGDLQMK